MFTNIFYILISLLGLGFLIFIHELGHFWVGQKMGMIVEAFSIGFGKPLKKWTSKGVVFQVGSIPFGGYVKFKGLEGDRTAPGGFFSVPYYKRILVALAGPLSNILLALVVFCLIYIGGGRQIVFAEKNPFIGFLPKGGFFHKASLREGDKIISVNDRPYTAVADYMLEKLTHKGPLSFKTESFPLYHQKPTEVILSEGGFLPANYLIFEKTPTIVPNEVAFLKKGGFELGDRLLAINGEPIFSKSTLVDCLQEPAALIHVERGGRIIALKVPKMPLSDIKMDAKEQGELTDWMHGAGLKQLRYFIPYDLSADLSVEKACSYLNNEANWQEPASSDALNPLMGLLQRKDRIIAINGQPVNSGIELVALLDQESAHIIFEKRAHKKLTLAEAIDQFWAPYLTPDFDALLQDPSLQGRGNLRQITIPMIRLSELKLSEKEKAHQASLRETELARINQIKDPKERSLRLKERELSEKKLMIGGGFNDQAVKINPNPFKELYEGCALTLRTLTSLFQGGLSPKHLSGPVAIIGVMQQGAKKSLSEGLYFFAIISINLAIFNLLPLPVLDGGHICFALYEGIFKKPVPQKVMDRLTMIFVILLISLIVFTTYHDILRFIQGMF